LSGGFITQIGYPPLRIDVLNSIDGVDFKDTYLNMQKIQLENDLVVNYIGLKDFIKNKQASGRAQGLIDVKTLQKIKKVNGYLLKPKL